MSTTGSSGNSSGSHSTGSSAKTVRSAAKPGRIRPSRSSLADGCGGARRVALESRETVDRLVVVRTAVALSRRTAKPCCRRAEARVEARDRPVGAECDERTGLSQRADRKGTPRRGALRAEPPRPVVGAVGLAPEHVLRLHRGDNPLGGEARQVLGLQRLDVLDPVPAMQRRRPRLTVCVERLTNAAVARRVRRALEAGAREGRDRPTIVLRVGPERQRPLALRVGLVQPARSRIDHAVDEELRDARPPTAAAGVAVREQLRPVVLLRLGDDRERNDEALDEIAVRFELAQEVVRRERPVHRVAAGQPCRGMLAQRRGVQRVALSVGELRQRTLDGRHSRPLAQLSCRRALLADDLRVLGEGPRAGHARKLERARRRHRGVQVHEGQERRRPLDDVLEQLPANAALTKDAVLEPKAEHPLVRRAALPLGGDRIANVLE